MAREYGVRVKAFNISREQIAYARERAAREGLSGQVEFIDDDYRNVAGRCDAFVSVGMLLDPRILIEHPLRVLAVLAVILICKSAAAFLIVRLFRHPSATALTVSAGLAQIGEFSFILAAEARDLGLMPAEGQSLILAAAILSIGINPFLFKALGPARARSERAGAPTAPEAPPPRQA